MARIFISHSSRNNVEAAAIRDWMMAEGFDDFFLDFEPERGISAGERWERALYDAADRCEAVIFLVSRDWLASDWCAREFDLAAKLSKRIFGVVIDDLPMSEIPVRYRRTWQLTSLSVGEDHRPFRVHVPPEGQEAHTTFSEGGLKRLKAGLFAAGLDPKYFAWPPVRDPERAPYRGLAALEAEDAGIFFGREASLIAALDRLRALAERAPPRLFIVLGASGAGKSSFLKAGLWPRLRRDDRNFLPLPVIRPSRAPVAGTSGLISSLVQATVDLKLAISRAEITSALASREATTNLLKRIAQAAIPRTLPGEEPAPAPMLVLCIDQAEELFPSSSRPEAEDLLAFLSLAARSAEVRVAVIFTIRSEFFGELQAAQAFEGLAQETFSLEPMPRGAFETTIEGPARRLRDTKRQFSIDPSLTDALLRDMEKSAGRDALPLLSFTLERIYREHAGKGVIDKADYEASGGLVGSIEAAVDAALVAARAIPGSPQTRDTQLALLRLGLIPWLAAIDPATGEPRRNTTPRKKIPPETLPLVDQLIEARLLLSYGDAQSGDAVVEPAHDALLRQWPVMVAWLKEDQARLVVIANLKEAARDWVDHECDERWLAHRAGRLEDAEALRDRPDLMAILDEDETSYLAACRREEDADRNRELEQERAARDAAEKAADAERRGRRKALTGLVFAAIFAIGALGAAAAALVQLRAAVANDSVALAALSLSAAKDGRNNDALILALASWPRSKWPELRPRLTRSIEAISYILSSGRIAQLQLIHAGKGAPTPGGAVLTRDERRIVSWASHSVRLWDTSTGAQLGPVMKHDGTVTGAVLTRDERRILSWSEDGTVRLWDTSTGEQIGPAMTHDSWVQGAVLTRDERRIVSWASDSVRLWDTSTGAQLGPVMKHDRTVTGAVLTRDERRILSWSEDGTVRLWDTSTGAQLGPVMKHHGTVTGAVLTRDERRILSWSEDGTARLWDTSTGAQIGPAMTHDDIVFGAVLTRDESRILSWAGDRVRLWDTSTGAQIGPAMTHDSWVHGAVLTRDERRILSWSADGTVRLWDTSTGAQIRADRTHGGSVTGAVLTRDERRIVSWAGNTVSLWDASTGAQIGPVLKHDDAVADVVLSRDESRILSWGEDLTARLWDTPTGAQIGPDMKHDHTVTGAVLTRDGSRILSWAGDTVRLWDTSTGAKIGPAVTHDDTVVGAVLTRDENRILSWSADRTMRLWDTSTGAQIGQDMTHGGSVTAPVLTRDGRRILSWARDRVRLWDTSTGAQIGPAMAHDGWVQGAVLTRDERRILSWSADGTVRLWDTSTGAQIGPVLKHDYAVTGVVLIRDESRILSWANDSARLWDTSTGAQIGPVLKHEYAVTGVVLTRDESRIVSWSNDRTVRLWDTSTGAQIGPALKHDDAVTGVVLSRDESRILSWAGDTVRLWKNSLPGNLVEVACSITHDHDILRVSTKYNISISEPICGHGATMPARP